MARRYQIPLGHVGHLNQIPRHLVPVIVSTRPEVWTIYSIQQSQWINAAAADQKIGAELRITGHPDNDLGHYALNHFLD